VFQFLISKDPSSYMEHEWEGCKGRSRRTARGQWLLSWQKTPAAGWVVSRKGDREMDRSEIS
jgi:hypothetical protein